MPVLGIHTECAPSIFLDTDGDACQYTVKQFGTPHGPALPPPASAIGTAGIVLRKKPAEILRSTYSSPDRLSVAGIAPP